MKRGAILISFILLYSLPAQAQKNEVFASNYPLAYFAQEIIKEQGVVHFPMIKGDPAFWQPSVEEILKIQQANLIVLNGAYYEKWLSWATLPQRKMVDTSRSYKDQYVTIQGTVKHTHGPKGGHSHEGLAFTTWIDFSQAALQAEAIKDALISKEFGEEEVVIGNFEALKSDLINLDKHIMRMTEGYSEMPILASHPVYDYFARRYNLNIKSVLWEPDSYPDESMWRQLKLLLKDHRAQWMIWEAEPLEESVVKLREMGIESIVFNPCGNTPDDGDFMSVMRENMENLKDIFK